MFICTLSNDKKEELLNKGFRLVCEQNHGDECVYTFSFNPSFYAHFDNDKDVFISDRMTMA